MYLIYQYDIPYMLVKSEKQAKKILISLKEYGHIEEVEFNQLFEDNTMVCSTKPTYYIHYAY